MFETDYKSACDAVKAPVKTREKILSLSRKKQSSFPIGKVLFVAALISILAVSVSATEFFQSWLRQYILHGSEVPLRQNEVQYLDAYEQVIDQSQTQDGYTVTLESAVTDGFLAYVSILVTAPEGTDFSHLDQSTFTARLTPQDASYTCISDSYENNGGFSCPPDEDDNPRTFHWVLEMEAIDNKGDYLFLPGTQWNLHIENLELVYLEKSEGNPNGEFIWETVAQGIWDFTFALDKCDLRSMELIQETPAPVQYESGLGLPSIESPALEENSILSCTLRAYSAVLTMQKDPSDFPACTVVMKDGSRIELLSHAKFYKQLRFKTDRPILLDDVDYVLVGEDTTLYAQEIFQG